MCQKKKKKKEEDLLRNNYAKNRDINVLWTKLTSIHKENIRRIGMPLKSIINQY